MVILSKNKSKVINFAMVNEIFKGGDGFSIKVNFSNGGGTQVERYNSETETNIALEMLCDAIGKTDKFTMPTDEQVKAHIIATKGVGSAYHNRYNGKKTKGHGGS